MVGPMQPLDRVREQIDGIDDRIHDLIMERTALVAAVIRAKAAAPRLAYRPGREARILRRIADRHDGPFPPAALHRIWREIISASLGLQGGLHVSIFGENGALSLLARNHFGTAATLSAMLSIDRVIDSVALGPAALGILPVPRDGERAPWWPRLADRDGISIVAKLPFLPVGADRPEVENALVIAAAAPEPSGADHSFLVLRRESEISRAGVKGILGRHDFDPFMVLSYGGDGLFGFLAEIDGFVESGDPRLDALRGSFANTASTVTLLGAYAKPLTEIVRAEAKEPAS